MSVNVYIWLNVLRVKIKICDLTYISFYISGYFNLRRRQVFLNLLVTAILINFTAENTLKVKTPII